MLRCLPNLVIMQPKDTVELVAMLKTALAHAGPALIRYPRDHGPAVVPPPVIDAIPLGASEIVTALPDVQGPVVWLWALGDMLPLARETAEQLAAAGVRAGVVNARFVKPLDTARLFAQAADAAAFVTLENGAVAGGFGSALREALAAGGVNRPVRAYGWPDAFVGQGTTRQLMEDGGLTPGRLSDELRRMV
jgi:1-deoxy-D-xylulose-5-phosphate synthase